MPDFSSVAPAHEGLDNSWNIVRKRLERGEPVIGMTISTSNVETAAYAATLGFHFLWAEMEHSSFSLESLRMLVLATRAMQVPIFARVPWVEVWMAKRVLDQGVHGVVFPFTSSAETALKASRSCRYPLTGLRGSGAGLAVLTWPGAGNYYDSADENLLVVCVIEEGCAVQEIDAIASTPGVDVIFIGTSDLAFSLGVRGDQNHPVVLKAVDTIVAAAQRHGKFLGRPAGSAEDIIRFRKQGFTFFQSLTELGLMKIGAQQLLEPLGIQTEARQKSTFY
jgi:2-keto-3-deoxy-L-rhamnonate aldolase RhmA